MNPKNRVNEILNNSFNNITDGSPEQINDLYLNLSEDFNDLIVEERLRTINLLEVKGFQLDEATKKFLICSK